MHWQLATAICASIHRQALYWNKGNGYSRCIPKLRLRTPFRCLLGKEFGRGRCSQSSNASCVSGALKSHHGELVSKMAKRKGYKQLHYQSQVRVTNCFDSDTSLRMITSSMRHQRSINLVRLMTSSTIYIMSRSVHLASEPLRTQVH